MAVFGIVAVATGRPTKKRPYTPIAFKPAGWQAWNSDPVMEHRTARLKGAGSFYWQGAVKALAEARRIIDSAPSVHQIKIETISGREIGRLYR
jgi:hypothetical protein